MRVGFVGTRPMACPWRPKTVAKGLRCRGFDLRTAVVDELKAAGGRRRGKRRRRLTAPPISPILMVVNAAQAERAVRPSDRARLRRRGHGHGDTPRRRRSRHQNA